MGGGRRTVTRKMPPARRWLGIRHRPWPPWSSADPQVCPPEAGAPGALPTVGDCNLSIVNP